MFVEYFYYLKDRLPVSITEYMTLMDALNKGLIHNMIENNDKSSTPLDKIGEFGLIKQLTKRLVEKAMDGELTHQLGYDKKSSKGKNSGNSRNGKSSKTLKGDFGAFAVTGKAPRH